MRSMASQHHQHVAAIPPARWGSNLAMNAVAGQTSNQAEIRTPDLAAQYLHLSSFMGNNPQGLTIPGAVAAVPFNYPGMSPFHSIPPALLQSLLGGQFSSFAGQSVTSQPSLGLGIPGSMVDMSQGLTFQNFRSQNLLPPVIQGQGMQAAGGIGGSAKQLPALLAQPEDCLKLSNHQVFLRHQIEAFRATEDDIATHTRGRNKPITLGQVGIRCRHCADLPVARRQKGSTYFPASLMGLYQAAQNMSTTHMQCGLCTEMPVNIKQQFAHLISSKTASSGAGRPYWAKSAEKLGLVDTEDGIRFARDIPPGSKVMQPGEGASKVG